MLGFIDPLSLLVMLPGVLLSAWASMKVKSTFHRYSEVRARSGMSGAEAARSLLRRAGVRDVTVEPVQGFLSDHYDPRAKALRLSPDVFHGRSLSALGVAAHEAGHALQHAHNYGPLNFRSLIVKPAGIGQQFGMLIATAGILLQAQPLLWVGIVLFAGFLLFTLVTLPVEFNASSRAIAILVDNGIVTREEAPHTRAVLNAAAMTYVAAAVSALMMLLYYLFRAGVLGGNRDD